MTLIAHGTPNMIARLTSSVAAGIIAVVTTTTADRIDENTHIKLGSAIAVAAVVIPSVFWIGGWMRGITDHLKENANQMSALRSQFGDLACQREDCPLGLPKPKTKRPP